MSLVIGSRVGEGVTHTTDNVDAVLCELAVLIFPYSKCLSVEVAHRPEGKQSPEYVARGKENSVAWPVPRDNSQEVSRSLKDSLTEFHVTPFGPLVQYSPRTAHQ